MSALSARYTPHKNLYIAEIYGSLGGEVGAHPSGENADRKAGSGMLEGQEGRIKDPHQLSAARGARNTSEAARRGARSLISIKARPSEFEMIGVNQGDANR
jgi:hypothetical protein